MSIRPAETNPELPDITPGSPGSETPRGRLRSKSGGGRVDRVLFDRLAGTSP